MATSDELSALALVTEHLIFSSADAVRFSRTCRRLLVELSVVVTFYRRILHNVGCILAAERRERDGTRESTAP